MALLLLIAFLAAAGTIWFVMVSTVAWAPSPKPIPFDADLWKSGAVASREAMLVDLIGFVPTSGRSNILAHVPRFQGLSREEIVALLGTPDRIGPGWRYERTGPTTNIGIETEKEYSYRVGRLGDTYGEKSLCFGFNEESKIESVCVGKY